MARRASRKWNTLTIPTAPLQEFPPSISLLTPSVDNSRTVTVAHGSVAQNAVTALILASSVPQLNCPTSASTICPIPGVSIRITNDPALLTPSPYASCQGSTLSDQTGTAHCSVVASCTVPIGSYPVYYTVGDAESYQGTVVITSGTAQNVAITSGNNQTGNAGQIRAISAGRHRNRRLRHSCYRSPRHLDCDRRIRNAQQDRLDFRVERAGQHLWSPSVPLPDR